MSGAKDDRQHNQPPQLLHLTDITMNQCTGVVMLTCKGGVRTEWDKLKGWPPYGRDQEKG